MLHCIRYRKILTQKNSIQGYRFIGNNLNKYLHSIQCKVFVIRLARKLDLFGYKELKLIT